jgi:hypothetical protein
VTANVRFSQFRGLRRHRRTPANTGEMKRVATRVATRSTTLSGGRVRIERTP